MQAVQGHHRQGHLETGKDGPGKTPMLLLHKNQFEGHVTSEFASESAGGVIGPSTVALEYGKGWLHHSLESSSIAKSYQAINA